MIQINRIARMLEQEQDPDKRAAMRGQIRLLIDRLEAMKNSAKKAA